MSDSRDYDPFSTTSLLNLSTPFTDSVRASQAFEFHDSLSSDVFKIPISKGLPLPDLFSRSFQLDLDDVPLPALESSTISGATSEFEDAESSFEIPFEVSNEEEDIWKLPEILECNSKTNLLTWDRFKNENHVEPQAAYTTEAGAATFSAILGKIAKIKGDTPSELAEGNIFLHALFELGLGRSSALFQWDDSQSKFISKFEKISTVGFSSELMADIIEMLAKTGLQTKKLLENTESVTQRARNFTTTQIGFFAVVRSCLFAIHKHLGNSRPYISSVLQIRSLYHSSVLLIEILSKMSNVTLSSTDDALVMSNLISEAQDVAINHPIFEGVMHRIVSCSVKPMLLQLSTEIGLTIPSLAANRNGNFLDEALTNTSWKTLLPVHTISLAIETKHTFSLLWANAPNCVLLSQSAHKSSDIVLELQNTWIGLHNLQHRALELERNLKTAILECKSVVDTRTASEPSGHILSSTATNDENPYMFKPDLFNETEQSTETVEDLAHEVVLKCLQGQSDLSTLQPMQDQALSMSVMPFLRVQHRLSSFEILQILFQDRKLVENLRLQYQFQLLGDGLFASKLSIALFDPDQASGEGNRRTGLTTGLRLQNRDTWPPASSELRLALMSILSESLSNEMDNGLADYISFAIRDLSDDELEQCRDVNSIHALDFLRLQYRQPNPLIENVMSNDILNKYDRIFKHLLRVLRLKSVAQDLLRHVSRKNTPVRPTSGHKFIIEVQQFISTIADYCQNMVIGSIWQNLHDKFQKIKLCIEKKDYEGTLTLGKSLEYLKKLHEDTLDEILHSLMLKRRQSDVRHELEATFNNILRFSAVVHGNTTDDTTIRSLHTDFKANVKTFLTRLKELKPYTEKRSDPEFHNDFGEQISLFDQLALRLDISGYWSKL